MSETSAAVVTAFNEPLEVRRVAIPELEIGAMLGRVDAATLCGTDVHLWHGRNAAKLPYIPGHETTLVIEEINGPRDDVLGQPLSVGDRVIQAYPFCGTCYFCAVANQPTLCQRAFRYGREDSGKFPFLLGGCAEHHYVPPQSDVVRVPEAVSSAQAASAACALRTVMHGFERLGPVASHETLVVQGCGPVGLYATAVARDRGAGKVLVIGAPDNRLQVAKAWGADDVLDLDRVTDAQQRRNWVQDHTDGRGADIAFQCAGTAAIAEGLGLVRPGGRYVSIGGGAGEVTVDARHVSANNLNIIGIRSGQGRHYLQALSFLANKKQEFPFDRLFSNTYDLASVSDALAAMTRMEEVKPIVKPKTS